MSESFDTAEAACLDEPKPFYIWQEGDIFFPEKGASTTPAKLQCFGCVLLNECLDNALENKDGHGIWGATSGRQREKINRTERDQGSETAQAFIESERQRDLTRVRNVLLDKKGPEMLGQFDDDYRLAEKARAKRKGALRVVNN